MSSKISVVTISLALISLFCTSCTGDADHSFSSIFESSFSAEITVESEDGEYEASLTLGVIKETEAESDGAERIGRDGNIAYSYPDTVSGISAVRANGTVSVNVCGITLTPSENIARKYTLLIDMADIRASDVERVEYKEHEGMDCAVLYVVRDGECAEVYIERGEKIPVMIKTDSMTVSFNSFTKL